LVRGYVERLTVRIGWSLVRGYVVTWLRIWLIISVTRIVIIVIVVTIGIIITIVATIRIVVTVMS